jgi:hypothetical protein
VSDYSAINGVSLTLRKLLLDRMEFTPNNLAITISTPFLEANQNAGGGNNPTPEGDRINLFLYQVSENPFLKNQELLSDRGSRGTLPLSLNLHYLITAYGSTIQNGIYIDESKAQQLLGSAMRVLNDYAIITESLLTTRLSPLGQTILDTSLRGQYETIKLCLDPISIEDLTKIWTALTVPYRLSAAYSVSVIQIESQRSRSFPQLVGEPPRGGPFISVLPIQTPLIEALTTRAAGDPPDVEHTTPYLHIGDTLIITGQHFGTDTALVVLNGLEIPIRPQSGRRIEIVVPDDTYSFQGTTYPIPAEQRLQPGLLAIEVKVAPPDVPEAATRSNQAAAMLTPFVQAVTPQPATQPRTLRLTGTRLYADELRCESIIGRFAIPSSAYVNRAPTQIELTLPLALPFTGAKVFFGQQLASFPNLNGALPSLDIAIGGVAYTGGNSVKLRTSPATFAEAAAALEEALHQVANREPEFTRARVVSLHDGATDRLILIPGVLTADIIVQNTADAAQLGLATLTERSAYFSGALEPFPKLTTTPGQLQVTFNSTQTVTLAQRPTSTAEAAAILQNALRAAGGGVDFTQAEVLVVGSQLMIVPGQNTSITIDGISGGDLSTVAELQLRGSYPVRVRVNGAEGIGGVNRIGLPL